LTRKEKEQQVTWLKEQFREARGLFLTNFQGLTVGEMDQLRADLRKVGVRYKVLKNTLARMAYQGTDVAHLAPDVVGPRAGAWTDDDDKIQPMAKVLIDFAKAHPNLGLVRGVVSGLVVDAAEMETLSKLPGRDELRGRLLGTMIAPISALVNTLAAVPRSFLNVLKAIEEQKTNSSEAPAV